MKEIIRKLTQFIDQYSPEDSIDAAFIVGATSVIDSGEANL